MSGKSVQRGFISRSGKSCLFLIAVLMPLPPPMSSVQAYHSLTHTRQHLVTDSAKQTGTDERPLEPGQLVEREMEGGAVHSYDITLQKGQYLHIAAEQLGIDLVLTLIGPDGKQLAEINRWGKHGQESISLIAGVSGNHYLRVRSPYKDATPGKYKLTIEELREAKAQDMIRINAEKAYDNGDKLSYQGTADSQRKAIESLEESLQLWTVLDDKLWKASTLLYIGTIYYELGETQKALDYNDQSLPLWRAVRDQDGEVFALSNIGRAYDSFGEYQQSLDYYELALPLARAERDKDWEATILHDIGMVYTSLGDYQQAAEYYNQGLKLYEDIKDRWGEAHLLHHIGEVYILAGEMQKALDVLNRALILSRDVKDALGEATTLNHLGRIYDALGKKQEALDYYGKALQLRRDKGYRLGEAQTLHNIGVVYESTGDYQKALDYNQQALLISRQAGDRRSEAYTLYSIAKTYRDKGDLAEARRNIEAAINIIENLRSKIASHELRSSYFATTHDFYELYIELLMMLHKQHPQEEYVSAALRASERARARSLLDLLSEARVDIRQGVNPVLLERERSLQHQLDAKADYQMRLLGGEHSEEQVAAIAKAINALTAEYQQAQAQIRQQNPRYAALTQPQPLTSQEIQRQVLDPDTLLLEYSLGEEHSYLWVVSPTTITSYELPKRFEIEKAAKRVYELVTARDRIVRGETDKERIARLAQAEAEYPAAAEALSRIVLEPAAAQLADKRLLIVSDSTLQYVPFAALPEPKANKTESEVLGRKDSSSNTAGRRTGTFTPLVVNHEIVSLPSASTLAELRSETSSRKTATKVAAVFADPVFDKDDERVRARGVTKSGDERISRQSERTPMQDVRRAVEDVEGASVGQHLERLLGSRWEAEAITSQVPAGMSLRSLDFAASREAVVSPALSQYRIVHFATHAFIDTSHPELSGIVLSLVNEQGVSQDGFLRVHDIFNLQLLAELVVLSACRTGLGKEVRGEGLVGLTRGFMYAGAPRVVASLWSVNDRATAELMRRFYRRMLGPERQRAAAALRAAQVEMWQDRRWQSPSFWAGFVLQGEWR